MNLGEAITCMYLGKRVCHKITNGRPVELDGSQFRTNESVTWTYDYFASMAPQGWSLYEGIKKIVLWRKPWIKDFEPLPEDKEQVTVYRTGVWCESKQDFLDYCKGWECMTPLGDWESMEIEVL